MKYVVTGGAGFVGSNLVKLLYECIYELSLLVIVVGAVPV